MSAALIFLMVFTLANCQENLYSLNPRFYNAFKLNAQSSFDDPLARSLLYQFSGSYEPQGAKYGDEIQSENLLARMLFNYPAVYVPPNSGSGTYSPNTGAGSYIPPTGPFWLKTRVYTTYVTSTVATLSYCIKSDQIAQGGSNICARRRREVAEILDRMNFSDDGNENTHESSINASPVNKVEITALPPSGSLGIADPSSSSTLSSSKKDTVISELSEADLKRTKRLFNIFAVPMTVTSYYFSTITILKTITPCAPAQATSCLSCVPFGFGIC